MLYIGVGVVVVIFGYLVTLLVHHGPQQPFQTYKLNNLALVISHPDDEVMFFAPTLLQLQRTVRNLYVICVTNGGYDGSPVVRQKELLASCVSLGVLRENVIFMNDTRFVDHPTRSWVVVDLSSRLSALLTKINVDCVLTFGSGGVSGHINHIDTHKAVAMLTSHRRLFLGDVNVIRKYSSLIDVVYTYIVNGIVRGQLIFVSGPRQVFKALHAMQCHHSQFVWFRKLYFLFSRYVIVNHLLVVEPSDKT